MNWPLDEPSCSPPPTPPSQAARGSPLKPGPGQVLPLLSFPSEACLTQPKSSRGPQVPWDLPLSAHPPQPADSLSSHSPCCLSISYPAFLLLLRLAKGAPASGPLPCPLPSPGRFSSSLPHAHCLTSSKSAPLIPPFNILSFLHLYLAPLQAPY